MTAEKQRPGIIIFFRTMAFAKSLEQSLCIPIFMGHNAREILEKYENAEIRGFLASSSFCTGWRIYRPSAVLFELEMRWNKQEHAQALARVNRINCGP